MKTAMQLMIEYLENTWYVKEIRDWEDIKINILEKEKEQIIDAMERTAIYVSVASIDKEIGKMTIEDLYNQTYN